MADESKAKDVKKNVENERKQRNQSKLVTIGALK